MRVEREKPDEAKPSGKEGLTKVIEGWIVKPQKPLIYFEGNLLDQNYLPKTFLFPFNSKKMKSFQKPSFY